MSTSSNNQYLAIKFVYVIDINWVCYTVLYMAQEISGTHFLGEVGQKVILEREGKVLLCRGIGSTSWDLPGGRLNKDEDPQTGLRREIKEELGIEVILKEPFYTCVKHDFKN